VCRYHASFSYQAGSWSKPRRVVVKVEWHPGELYPRVGFIVTNMTRPAERVVAFYNQRGTAEQWIKEGKNAVAWTRLSCHRFAANAVRLQLHALAYNMANFLRTLALLDEVKQWSLTTLRERLVKDRRQDRTARKIGHVPDGRSHGAACTVPADPGRYRDTTTVAAGTMLSICAVAATSGLLGSRCARKAGIRKCSLALPESTALPQCSRQPFDRPERCQGANGAYRSQKSVETDGHLGNVV
jgi:hypothetical protein